MTVEKAKKLGIHINIKVPLYAVTAAAFAFLCLNTAIVSDSIGRALSICVKSVIPSLLPFMIVTSFAVKSGFMEICGRPLNRLMRLLFKVGGEGGSAFFTGALSGFPLGAECAVGLYKNGSCTRDEAERMIAFCNNTGPAFVIGGIGMAMRGSAADGIIIYVSQLAAAVICGILLRFTSKGEVGVNSEINNQEKAGAKLTEKPVGVLLIESVEGASLSMLKVCGYVACFSVICAALDMTLSAVGLNILPEINALLYGTLEITNGCSFAASVKGAEGVAVSAAITSWSGISVLMQTASLVGEAGLSVRKCTVMKSVQAALAALIAYMAASAVTL